MSDSDESINPLVKRFSWAAFIHRSASARAVYGLFESLGRFFKDFSSQGIVNVLRVFFFFFFQQYVFVQIGARACLRTFKLERTHECDTTGNNDRGHVYVDEIIIVRGLVYFFVFYFNVASYYISPHFLSLFFWGGGSLKAMVWTLFQNPCLGLRRFPSRIPCDERITIPTFSYLTLLF